jgi:hypothetical protein
VALDNMITMDRCLSAEFFLSETALTIRSMGCRSQCGCVGYVGFPPFGRLRLAAARHVIAIAESAVYQPMEIFCTERKRVFGESNAK